MVESFAVIVRLMWIDHVIEEEGQINRADIMRAFGVSPPQASIDIKRYIKANPRRIAYDVSAKTYVRVDGSHGLFWRGARWAAADIVRQIACLGYMQVRNRGNS